MYGKIKIAGYGKIKRAEIGLAPLMFLVGDNKWMKNHLQQVCSDYEVQVNQLY